MSLASWSVESSRHTAVIDLNQGITYKIWCFLSWRREVVAPPSQGLRLAEHIGSSLFPLGSVLFCLKLAGSCRGEGMHAREGNQGGEGQEQMWAPGEVISKK